MVILWAKVNELFPIAMVRKIGRYNPFDPKLPKFVSGEQRAEISEWGKQWWSQKVTCGTLISQNFFQGSCFSKIAPL